MSKYTIGIDFGSLSGRAVLMDTETGREVATATLDYPHAVDLWQYTESGEVDGIQGRVDLDLWLPRVEE